MAKYQELVDQLKRQIQSGIWNPGDKLPSLRKQSEHTGISLMTVLHAYQLLESQGWVVSQARSGYRVAPRVKTKHVQPPQVAVSSIENVDINEFIFEVLQASKNPQLINFGFAYPSPDLYPHYHVTRAFSSAARNMPISNTFNNLPPGNEQLRQLIAKRYAARGIEISPDEIVITAGALEALNLSLQACASAGDWIVVESPTFYGALQSLQRLGLKALSIRTDPVTGIDIDSLERALQTHPVKACWLMSNHQNPLGFTLTDEKKKRIVDILNRYNVALIEDDVYSELYEGSEPITSMKMYDHTGNTMLCSSFSKSLIAGLRIGWVVAGKRALDIQKLQLMSTFATSAPIQMTLVHYLTSRNYELHLKQLRKRLAERKKKITERLRALLPDEVNIISQKGGYFVWLELPEHLDATYIYDEVLKENVSIAPGKMFSLNDQYNHCIRLNASFELDHHRMRALDILASSIVTQINGCAQTK
ncbi:aminotransferase-like domain-containing protein [Vibrio sp. MEBiC08052]|uniref:aminotransferase-like domain-containing protein n=1 Tax=Vibrio sp. MEBiC08052 TaxID=1761910 RepID=UPI0007406BBC|nr:PLP-dependent aminotransferase family protein [Vibrio sp. MEBiC08052]KUI99661.1 aminotransferase, classes I/II family [Vibrio sp. MEBiC08052]